MSQDACLDMQGVTCVAACSFVPEIRFFCIATGSRVFLVL